MTLYEINQELLDWLTAVEEQEGELTPELMIALEGITQNFDAKAEAIACFVKSLRAEAEAIKAEKTKLEARQRSKSNLADRLVGQLEDSMRLHNRTKCGSARYQATWRKSSAVKLTDESALPEEYWKTTKTPMLSEISTAIKAGTAVPGAEIEEREKLWVR